jgi:hypothetical protein
MLAIASISIGTSIGNRETWTVDLAGIDFSKNSAYISLTPA